jgi:magnesium-protoporphyrin O-methyltransferase
MALTAVPSTAFSPRRHAHLPTQSHTHFSVLYPHRATPPLRLRALPPATDLPSLDAPAVAAAATSVAAIAAAFSLSDPERRRRQQAEASDGDEKAAVKEYFNSTGFDRWRKIYGSTDDVNRVQLDIRIGHAQTVEATLRMLRDAGPIAGANFMYFSILSLCMTLNFAKYQLVGVQY